MQSVFRTRTFTRWMRKAGVTDAGLRRAVAELVQGLVDADLGGYLMKKRVALPGQGKRRGARTKVEYDELKALQELAKDLLALDDALLAVALASGEIVEVKDETNRS